MGKEEESIGRAATKIAEDIEANCIVSLEQKKKEEIDEDFTTMDVRIVIFRQLKPEIYAKREYSTKIRKSGNGSIVPIKEVLMEAIKKRYLNKGDRIVCVADESMGTGYKGLLFVFDVDKIFFDISTHDLADHINSDVIESIINIAQELSKEGREGRKIGTAFIVGNKSDILKYIRQLIINPFAGCTEEQRKITDPEIKETVKEFAQLDGVFIIDEKGTIVTAGAYLDIDTNSIDDLKGLGTKHRCSAALTKATNAIAIVVSESGGVVRIFKDGKIIMKLT